MGANLRKNGQNDKSEQTKSIIDKPYRRISIANLAITDTCYYLYIVRMTDYNELSTSC